MPNGAIQLHGITEDLAIAVRTSDKEILEDVLELEARSQLHILENSTSGMRTAAQPEIARRSVTPGLAGDRQALKHRLAPRTPGHDRRPNARQIAEKLGDSERWMRDHTPRQSPQIRAVIDKGQSTLDREYWTVSVEPVRLSLFGVFEQCAVSRIVVTANFECSGGIDDL